MSQAPWYTFESPPGWILRLRHWSPWSPMGRGRILRELETLHKAGSPQLYDSPAPSLTEEAALALRLLNCLLYHWDEAGYDVSYEMVVGQLQNAQGFRDGGKLGGNPLFDLIFAAALLGMNNKAAIHFEKEYKDDLLKTAGSFKKRYESDQFPPQWWNDYFFYLTQPRRKTGRILLDDYLGLSGIKPWFRKALTFFLRDQLKVDRHWREKVRRESEICVDENDFLTFSGLLADTRPDTLTEEKLRQIQEIVAAALARAKESISSEQWRRITLFLVDKEQNQKIAKLFDEDAATTTRKRNEALEIFRKTFFVELEKMLIFDTSLQQMRDEMGFDFARAVSNFFESQSQEK